MATRIDIKLPLVLKPLEYSKTDNITLPSRNISTPVNAELNKISMLGLARLTFVWLLMMMQFGWMLVAGRAWVCLLMLVVIGLLSVVSSLSRTRGAEIMSPKDFFRTTRSDTRYNGCATIPQFIFIPPTNLEGKLKYLQTESEVPGWKGDHKHKKLAGHARSHVDVFDNQIHATEDQESGHHWTATVGISQYQPNLYSTC